MKNVGQHFFNLRSEKENDPKGRGSTYSSDS